jgi:hypothetical protein
MITTHIEKIHADAHDVPDGVWKIYPSYWRKHLGKSIDVLFSGFAQAFPSAAKSMHLYWTTPVMSCQSFPYEKDIFVCKILSTLGEKMLVMGLNSGRNEDLTDELFDQNTEMLPPRWKELYRWFDSFYIVEGREFQRYWINSPFAFATRVNPDEYAQKIGADKSTGKALEKFIGSPKTQIKCWLYTEAGDALFLDEARNDHKVYHVNKGNIKDIAVLPHPEDTLDEYLAHYVSGKAPKDFDFRAS